MKPYLLAPTGALIVIACHYISARQLFDFSLSPLILSMIISMTSWGHDPDDPDDPDDPGLS